MIHSGIMLRTMTGEDWNNTHLKTCRIVAEKEDEIVGWAALKPV